MKNPAQNYLSETGFKTAVKNWLAFYTISVKWYKKSTKTIYAKIGFVNF